MPKRGRGDQLDAAVELARLAGQQRMHGRIEAERGGRSRHVVDLAVGDHDRRRRAVGRHVGERLIEIGEQHGAVAAVDIGDGRRSTGRHALRDRAPSPRRSSSSARIASVCSVRPAMVWLWLSSTTTMAMSLSGSRSSLSQVRVGERQHQHGKGRARAGRRRACAPEQQASKQRDAAPATMPEHRPGDEAVRQGGRWTSSCSWIATGPAVRAGRERAPGRPCSCRSARTSPGSRRREKPSRVAPRRRGRRDRSAGSLRRAPRPMRDRSR